jgi:hypothetical protein
MLSSSKSKALFHFDRFVFVVVVVVFDKISRPPPAATKATFAERKAKHNKKDRSVAILANYFYLYYSVLVGRQTAAAPSALYLHNRKTKDNLSFAYCYSQSS